MRWVYLELQAHLGHLPPCERIVLHNRADQRSILLINHLKLTVSVQPWEALQHLPNSCETILSEPPAHKFAQEGKLSLEVRLPYTVRVFKTVSACYFRIESTVNAPLLRCQRPSLCDIEEVCNGPFPQLDTAAQAMMSLSSFSSIPNIQWLTPVMTVPPRPATLLQGFH